MIASESQIRASKIVKRLYDRGVDLYVEDGEIRYKSRIEGTVTNDHLVDLDENKAEIIALLLKQGMPDNWTATLADREGAGDEAG